jgi:hypothetical protein
MVCIPAFFHSRARSLINSIVAILVIGLNGEYAHVIYPKPVGTDPSFSWEGEGFDRQDMK